MISTKRSLVAKKDKDEREKAEQEKIDPDTLKAAQELAKNPGKLEWFTKHLTPKKVAAVVGTFGYRKNAKIFLEKVAI